MAYSNTQSHGFHPAGAQRNGTDLVGKEACAHFMIIQLKLLWQSIPFYLLPFQFQHVTVNE